MNNRSKSCHYTPSTDPIQPHALMSNQLLVCQLMTSLNDIVWSIFSWTEHILIDWFQTHYRQIRFRTFHYKSLNPALLYILVFIVRYLTNTNVQQLMKDVWVVLLWFPCRSAWLSVALSDCLICCSFCSLVCFIVSWFRGCSLCERS